MEANTPKPYYECNTHDLPLIDEAMDDTLSRSQNVVEPSEHLEHTASSMDKRNNNEESKERSTCQSEDQIDTSMLREIKNIRRSHRAKILTNRFTIADSDCQPIKSQSKKNRQPVQSKSIPVPIEYQFSDDQECIAAVNKVDSSNVKSSATRKEDTIKSLRAKKVIDVERPQRNRKKTDFYHDTISLEETRKFRTVVLNSPVTTPTVIHNDAGVSIPNPGGAEDSNCPDPTAYIETDILQDDLIRRGSSVVLKSENIDATSVTMEEGWSTDQLEQLRDAQQDVDPTSISYWMDIAIIVQGKTASECQAKWFSMTKTPAPKTKNTRVAIDPSHRNELNDDEDDIFQSTPMRGNMFLNSNYYQSFSTVNMPQLPTPSLPSSEVEYETFDPSTFAPIVKPVSKAFLQRMKRNFTKAEATIATKSKALHKNHSRKNTKALTEVLRDHDMDINIRLTPGGTLQVKSHVDNDEDDFWDDEYDADEENEDRANYYC